MQAPLVSVVMAFFNGANFMEEAIESVLAQSYRRWELLLVDDGSTDESSVIGRRYATRFPSRIRYLEHPGHMNRGVSASRNLGISASTGSYVALLDADDVWLTEKLKSQIEQLEAFPEIGLVFGSPIYWRSWTLISSESSKDVTPDNGWPDGAHIYPPDMLIHSYPLGARTPPIPSDLMVRREVVELVGGFEEQFQGPRQLYEDQVFLVKVYLAQPVLASKRCWTRYREHSESCDSKVIAAGEYHEVRLYFLEYLEQYLHSKHVTDRRIWKALRTSLLPYRHPLVHRVSSLIPAW